MITFLVKFKHSTIEGGDNYIRYPQKCGTIISSAKTGTLDSYMWISSSLLSHNTIWAVSGNEHERKL